MNTTQDLSIVSLVIHASLLAQAVMALLLILSLLSWTYIIRKWFAIRRARNQTERFERDFWSGGDLAQLYRAIEQRGGVTGMASIFEFGFREFARLRQQGISAPDQWT